MVEITRQGTVTRRRLRVAPGTLVRAALTATDQSPEGSAVLLDNVSIPLDTPIERSMRLMVVPTFSGG